MIEIKSESGHPIRNLEDWFKHAPPAGGETQWVDGRSAKELAKAWIGPGMPEELTRLMDSHAATRGFVIQKATPEMKITFDEIRGGVRNADLQLLGHTLQGLMAVSIEGKADEPFGDSTIGEHLKTALAKNPRTGVPERIDGLCRALFGEAYSERFSDLRYQLLHATAATLVQAQQDNAKLALFLVHEFRSSKTTDENLARNDRDFRAFFSALGGLDAASLDADRIHGPIRIPGGGMIPGDVELHVAKISVRVS